MLSYDDALNMNYYKKTSFTGWMGGMRLKIQMETVTIEVPAGDGSVDESGNPAIISKEEKKFHAWVWPGPYIFDLTPNEKKVDYYTDFTEKGRKEVVDWINEQYESRMDEWPKRKTDEV